MSPDSIIAVPYTASSTAVSVLGQGIYGAPPGRQAWRGLVPFLAYLSALTETTVAEVARTSSLGSTGNTALGVPAAAHTTS